MTITETSIPGLLRIKPKVFADPRGYFFESYNQNEFENNSINVRFIQDNESQSSYGVIRGLHYQLAPYAQTKLVRVIKGTVLDIALDIRNGSPTFGKWESVILSEDNKEQFLIPKGFAHGFAVLSETAIFCYKCDELYNPEAERGISYLDPELNIDWEINLANAIVSDKDIKLPAFKNAEYNFTY